jgi:hypothetical protein
VVIQAARAAEHREASAADWMEAAEADVEVVQRALSSHSLGYEALEVSWSRVHRMILFDCSRSSSYLHSFAH